MNVIRFRNSKLHSSVLVMPMGVKGGSRIMSDEGHLLSNRLGWDQLYGGNTTVRYWLLYFGLRLTFNKVRIKVTSALRQGLRISA